MTAIDQLFARLRQEKKKAFMPFITAADPSLEFTQQLALKLDRLGCHLIEVGIPYSDPIADGPVIQASYTRALQRKVKLKEIFDGFAAIQSQLTAPRVTMVSYATIHRLGASQYLDSAMKSGFSGVIVPDLLVEECEALATQCRQRQFDLIQLVTPTTPPERALRIAEKSTGFLYFVSVTGITGERTELPTGLAERVQWLRERTPLPICIGFGISRPEHIRLLSEVADGLIVGSAIVRQLAIAGQDPQASLNHIEQLVREFLGALP